MSAALAFLDQLHFDAGDQAAVVTFNSDAWLLAVLTPDRTALDAAIADMKTGQFTRIDLGIVSAREELLGPRRHGDNTPVMIVLTDGRANPEPVETAIEQAEMAKRAGITLFVIGLGVPEALDDEALRLIASRPGYYYRTSDADNLAAIYEEIAEVIPCPPELFWGRR
jgi:Mg-chelatase subunit ChlD